MLLAAVFVVGAFLVLFESPASADNCKELVKNIGDLANKNAMEDCLRTGNRFSKTIGTVVAVSAISTALVGLSKPPPKPPPEVDDIEQHMDPCVRAKRRARRLTDLKAELDRLEADVLKEFKECADGAMHFNKLFRDLKELQYQMWKAVALARLGNATAIMWITTAVRTLFLKSSMPLLTKAMSAVNIPAASTEFAGIANLLNGLTVSGIGEFSGSNMPGAATPIRPGDPGAPAVPGVSIGGFQMFTDPMARDMQAKLDQHLQRLFTLYSEDAQQFNREWEQWGISRRAQVFNLRAEVNDERKRWQEEADQCPDLKGQLPPLQDRKHCGSY